jgi:hypothetical protein
MDEMDVESIDLGDELRQGVKPGLALAPVVLGRPSCTPCDASVTVSRSGHCVALMRLRSSVSFASGTLTT